MSAPLLQYFRSLCVIVLFALWQTCCRVQSSRPVSHDEFQPFLSQARRDLAPVVSRNHRDHELTPSNTGLLFAATAFAADAPVAADVFTSSDLGISFALNVPVDSNDLYFSLTGPGDGSWLAVGWGSNRMANALMIIAYPTSNGSYVTVSPRIGTGHTEPTIAPNVTVQLLAGSGVLTNASNNILTINARCINCRSWSGGSIDVTSKAQNMVFAYGPWVGNPNSVNADLRMHNTDGVFTMDMTKATGQGGVPEITGSDSGATQVSILSTHDLASPIHGEFRRLNIVLQYAD